MNQDKDEILPYFTIYGLVSRTIELYFETRKQAEDILGQQGAATSLQIIEIQVIKSEKNNDKTKEL